MMFCFAGTFILGALFGQFVLPAIVHRHSFEAVNVAYGKFVHFGGGDATQITLLCRCGANKQVTHNGYLTPDAIEKMYRSETVVTA